MSNKKIFAFASATLCFISVVAGLSYMKKNGVFERYPDAVYLDDDDAVDRSARTKRLYIPLFTREFPRAGRKSNFRV